MQLQTPLTITEVGQQIRSGVLTSENLVKHYLERIKNLNPTLNAFITVTEQQAMATAAMLDAELTTLKDRGRLHGIPIVIKDNIDTAGIRTTVGAEIFSDRIPTTDATIVQQLQAAGAVILGKTNLTEFAADISGRNQFYGDIRNVWNHDCSPGGSSSGTATAVAAHLCLGGIGTDTGGSIRVPASWSGVVGLRPTHGVVSTQGVFPRSPSFDTVGIMANTVENVAIFWEAINGDTIYPISTKGLRLGVVQNYTYRGVDSAVAKAVYRAIARFRELGFEVVTIESSFLEHFHPAIYFQIAQYEFYQALQQYAANPEVFGSKVRSDLLQGMKISAATYAQAQDIRRQQIAEFKQLFTQVDAILTPTTPTVAPLMTAPASELNRRFILPFSFAGVPSISIPCGWSDGLPIGLQIIGNHFAEAIILRTATCLTQQDIL